MTTFIKTKFKISEDQTNIDIYRVAANITKISCIKFNLPQNQYFKIHEDKAIISFKKKDVKMSKINMFKMDVNFMVKTIELLRFLHCT